MKKSNPIRKRIVLLRTFVVTALLTSFYFLLLWLLNLVIAYDVFASSTNDVTLIDDSPSPFFKSFLAFQDKKFALQNVTLFRGNGTKAEPNHTILIDSGIIEKVISPSEEIELTGYKQIDLTGHTVVPGLIGTHNHMRLPQGALLYTSPKLYLASGVTTIQTCGTGNPIEEIAISRNIEAFSQPGPDIIPSSPYFTGPKGKSNFIKFDDEERIRDKIRFWASQGVQWFKVYMHTRPQDLEIIVDEAHKNGAKVTGHLCATTYKEAALAGIDAIEHGFINSYDHSHGHTKGLCSGSKDFRSSLDLNSIEVQELQNFLIENNVAISSTPSIFEAQTVKKGFADERTLRALSPFHIESYLKRRERMKERADDWYFKDNWLERSLTYDLAFYRKGGLLTAGPDPGLHNLPGYGDQRNYELFVEAGFKAEEALEVLTTNGAKLLGLDDVGFIAKGMRANMVVLKGDLTKEPSVIRNVKYVIKDGFSFDPKKLIESVEGHVGSSFDDSLKYLGQKEPSSTPEKFATNLITTSDEHEFGSVFSRNGDEFFHAVDLGHRSEIRGTRLINGVWTDNQPVINHPIYSFNDPFLSADGSKLFYISDMPLKGIGSPKDYDIWYSIRTSNGWSLPIHGGPVINSDDDEYFVSVSDSGRFYFSSNRGHGSGFDIFQSQLQAEKFSPPQKLPNNVNSQGYDADVFVSPNDDYIIFSSIREEGAGAGDLYISFKLDEEKWTDAISLDTGINTPEHELCPFITKDGKYFMFTRGGDIYWRDAGFIESFKNSASVSH